MKVTALAFLAMSEARLGNHARATHAARSRECVPNDGRGSGLRTLAEGTVKYLELSRVVSFSTDCRIVALNL
jgi:hypothetical protein